MNWAMLCFHLNRGFRVNRIAVHGFGGDVTGNHGRANPKDQFLISIAGPAAGFILGLPFLVLQMMGTFGTNLLLSTLSEFLFG